MVIRIDSDEWRPEQRGVGRWRGTDRLAAGKLVILDRRPYRVVEIREVDPVDWPEDYRDAWVQHGMPDAGGWFSRPMVVVVRSEEEPKEGPLHLQCGASMRWRTLPEHYAVCRLCRELPPCRHEEVERTVGEEVATVDRLMAIPRGACLGCGETITSRMTATRFPGPNLWRPDWGTDSAVFHGRSREECSNGVWRYKEAWQAQGLDDLNPTLPKEAS
ncbi:hypothetical protein [Streptomyces sp. H27-D2]|uniref:hypothetical protein n=1 Tax=Streptomyces sp. H27-D2 TaxID=3046304 RepID=UPI002DBBA63A|nr:hypothetical protein [Streptomyces sp. H27-D2]MEC4016060.1 hypothetical protein [Streptomyces sp. H27-D2]